jgi:uncharacterized protein
LANIHKYPGLIILFSAVIACLVAQFIKLMVNLLQQRKFDFGILVQTGGMPSSHSAMVTSLATGVALVDGLYSTQFALALCFALIVMYDATGVRRSVGIQATILNQIIVEFNNDNPELKMQRIKEFLGHTPFEVLAGSCLGITIGFVFWYLGLLS